MRIALNLLSGRPSIGGAWTCLRGLIDQLTPPPPGMEFLALVTRDSLSLVERRAGFEIVRFPASRGPVFRVLMESMLVARTAERHGADLVHWTVPSIGVGLGTSLPATVTVHDLKGLIDSSTYGPLKRIYWPSMWRRLARRADLLLPVSEATARDLEQRLGIPRDRIQVVRTRLPRSFRRPPAEAVERFRKERKLPERFWLYVANTYPHKNHRILLEAWSLARDRAVALWPLVLRGEPGAAEREVERQLERRNLRDRVTRLPELAEEEVPLLYGAASGLAFPSGFEGAGLPVAEAAACGCPVVAAAGVPAVREYAGPDAVFVQGNKAADWLSGLANVQDRIISGRFPASPRQLPEAAAGSDVWSVWRSLAPAPGRDRQGCRVEAVPVRSSLQR